MNVKAQKSVKSSIEQCKAYFQAADLKLTPLRKEILAILYNSIRVISAYDILRQLRQSRPNAEPPTVYRVLDDLQRIHVVHKVKSENGYFCCKQPETAHIAQVLLCTRCGEADEIKDRNITKAIQKSAESHGFKFSSDLVEIHGVCMKCSHQER